MSKSWGSKFSDASAPSGRSVSQWIILGSPVSSVSASLKNLRNASVSPAQTARSSIDSNVMRSGVRTRPSFWCAAPRNVGRRVRVVQNRSRRFSRTRCVRPLTPHPQNKKGPQDRPLFILAERVRLLAAGDGRSSSASLRTDACASSKIAPGDFVELGAFVH